MTKEFDNNYLTSFEKFVNTIKALRDPENGCPWDIKQNVDSLRNNLIEEAYECVEAINNKDIEHSKEELGDLMLVALMITYIHEQDKNFTLNETFQTVTEKLIRRHPHVFGGESKADTADEVIKQWDDIKENIEGRRKKDSIIDGIKDYLPPLTQAYKLQKKAAKIGFDWNNVLDIFNKLDEEKDELIEAIYSSDKEEIENEIGDLLFTVINISRYLKVEPGIALHKTISKFKKRFHHIEKEMKNRELALNKENIDLMEKLWNEAKDL